MTRMSLAERRHKLIEAALRVIGESGVPAATTRAIAAEAGMPLASFHYAFESHQNLMGEALSALVTGELADDVAWRPEGDSVEGLVASILGHHLDDLVARTEVHRTLSELCDYALRTEGLQEVPAEWRQRRLERLTASLEAHERATGIRLPRPVDDFAQYLLVTCDGMTGTYLATHDEGLVRGVAGSCSTMVGSIAA